MRCYALLCQTERRKSLETFIAVAREDIKSLSATAMPYPRSCLWLALLGSMSLRDYPRLCSATSHRNHCYIPVTPSITVCSDDVNPTFGPYLPSSYQGNLWLLDHCQDSYCEAPCCESPSCVRKTCTPSCDPTDSCVPYSSSSANQVVSDCETTDVGSRSSRSPCTGPKRYVSNCTTGTGFAPKACQTFRNGSCCIGQFNSFPKNLQAQYPCILGHNEYRSYRNFGFITNGFSPSCYTISSYRPRSYLMRYCQYPNYGSSSFSSRSYLCRNFQSLSYIPSTFPPLRYLCSSNRPLNCY